MPGTREVSLSPSGSASFPERKCLFPTATGPYSLARRRATTLGVYVPNAANARRPPPPATRGESQG